jgi:hypothetical protein
MTHPSDPEQIYQAQCAGAFGRLRDFEHVNERDAEHWISRWEREAEAGRERGQGFGDDGWRWIAEPPETLRSPTLCTPPGRGCGTTKPSQ